MLFEVIKAACQAAGIRVVGSEALDKAQARPFFVTLRLLEAERQYSRVLDVVGVDVMFAPGAKEETAADARRAVAEAIIADGRAWLGRFAPNAVPETHGKREFERWRVEARLLRQTG